MGEIGKPVATVDDRSGTPYVLGSAPKPRVSRLAVVAMLLSVLSCPPVLSAVWSQVELALQFVEILAGISGGALFLLLVILSVALATLVSVAARWRISGSDGSLNGQTLATVALGLSLVWWIYVPILAVLIAMSEISC